MSQFNCTRAGCRDVFRAFLVENASYDGFLEIPVIDYCNYRPKKLIAFSKAISSDRRQSGFESNTLKITFLYLKFYKNKG